MALSSSLCLRDRQREGSRSTKLPTTTRASGVPASASQCPPVLIVLDHVLQGGRPVDAPLELGSVEDLDLVLELLNECPRAPAKVEAEVGEIGVGMVSEVQNLLALPAGHLGQLCHVSLIEKRILYVKLSTFRDVCERTACQNHDLTRPKPKKTPGAEFFSGHPGPLEDHLSAI